MRWFRETEDSRSWEEFYRKRWSYDYSVRTAHGVNCSMACSWEVFVKDGMIVWELQKVDYPQIEPDVPNVEPRGCQRGVTASWYPYSPLRPKYPYVRKVLWDMYYEERKKGKDPVEAWASIVEDEERSKRYKSARGKGGWKRVTWDEATEMIAGAQIYTIKKYGPDHIASFSPIPAMSLLSFISGQRYNNLLGGIYCSYYEWYHDLPHNSPAMWGDQTENCESSDWYQSTYIIIAGTNLNMTRTADCHFIPEAKMRGTKIVSVSPNYSDVTKYADLWIPLIPGSDGAFFMACIHVILKEFFVEREVPYFKDYVKRYTNLPFLVILDRDGNKYRMGRFLRASDLYEYSDEENADWKLIMMDKNGKLQLPMGSIGFRWEKEPTGRWNLQLKNAKTGEDFDPLLSLLDHENLRCPVIFYDFTDTFSIFPGKTEGKGKPPKEIIRDVPAKVIKGKDGKEIIVTTAFDLLMAQVGVSRGLGGDYPKDYDDPKPFTPAWQESQTGVSRNLAIQVGREFAENAEKTQGRSMVITGPGLLHFYHGGPLYYRALAVMLALCGCNGRNGGNFNHYVGTQHTRLHAAFVNLGGALDWTRPPRMQNSTSFWYFHTGQWRYDPMTFDTQWAENTKMKERYNHAADMNALAVRLGWLPFYPTFDKKNPLEVYEEAIKAGCRTDEEVVNWIVKQFKEGRYRFAIHDPDAKENHLKVLIVWRGNLIGTSMRGQEIALKHFLGTHHNVLWEEEPAKGLIKEIEWREQAPIGKLDLLVNLNIRMDSTANYADIVLPAAFWYEKYDVTFGDMHTFVHPLTPAIQPPWEAKHDWEAFKLIAQKFSELAKKHFPKPVKDVVVTALFMDSPDQLAQPKGEVKDWKYGECEPVPGKTFPKITIVERDYTKIYDKLVSLGPLVCQPKGYGSKGHYVDLTPIVEELKNNEVLEVRNGKIYFEKPEQICELILQISPELNGRLAYMFFKEMEKKVGLSLTDLVEPVKDRKVHYKDIISQPRRIHTTPQWGAILINEDGKQRTFAPWTLNVERLKPWHTLSGRQEIYYDHQGFRELGEALPTYKPPLDTVVLGDINLKRIEPKSKVLRFITPHGKWQIHSSFRDHWPMMQLSRGGPTVWLNPEDAKEMDIEDNDWVEMWNENGIEVVRAVVSHQVPRGMAITYHQVERHVNIPFSPLAKKYQCSDLRGGNNNATTRILMNPGTMIGGYAQFSYYTNYWGTSPSERDHCVLIRKMPHAEGRKKVIYKEEEMNKLPAK
ncbi:nitrate reductase subunit alpha [Hydrogenobacter thermophilus]|uniref:nitrate reductase subunit alpha n=1 Tax=Hydrogenobacter thermophilus TaxID=940 RepID=UPI0030FB5F84